MDIITRSCVLFLWLHTLPFVKSEVCTLEDFLGNEDLNDGNFNTVGLKPSYAPGEEVRVGCRAGYSGFFKLQCMAGGRWWSGSNPCKPKPCGHPGDAPNADFALDGEDYVFGSRVIYTCHEGYRMVSRRHVRNCVERGWDGVIPVCEALTCPAFSVESNVQLLGDPEEASYGSVLRFRCKSRSQILSGAHEVFCKGNGQWSDTAPKCTGVKCTVPNIEHGFVPGRPREYSQDDILDYQCHPGYGRIDFRSSTCTKIGIRAEWSPTPVCERVICVRELQDPLVADFRPPPLTQIRVSDTATYSCIGGYKKKAKKATCTGDGWTPKQLCEEIICNPHDILNVDVDKLEPIYRDQERVNAACKPGYKGGYTLTCTENGWRGHGECAEVKCRRNDYDNAEIEGVKKREYRYNEIVDYICNNGFTGHFTLTCGQDGWTGNPVCAAVTCTKRTFPNADIAGTPKAVYNYNDRVQYDCEADRGFFFLKCGQNGWEGSDECRVVTCNSQLLPDTEIVGEIKSLYAYKDTVEYSCTGEQQGRFVLTCGPKGWTGSKECKACPKPKVEHGFMVGPQNYMLYYTCEQGYKLTARGWWGVTKCNSEEALAECIEESNCGALPAIPNMEVQSQRTNHRNGSSVRIICKEGYSSEVQDLRCNEGEWYPNNTSLCTPIAKHCDSPPEVENAVPEALYQKEYPSGFEITYHCRYHYTIEGSDTIKCNNGAWEDSSSIRCTRINTHCPRAPKVEHAEIISQNRDFQSGESANYRCKEQYTSEGDPKIMCNDGEWGERMFQCIPVSCDPPVAADNVRVSGVPVDGKLISPGQFLTFSCDQSKTLKGYHQLTCGTNGKWDHQVPSCEEKLPPTTSRDTGVRVEGSPSGLGCGRPPALQGGDITTIAQNEYTHNDRVKYSCFNLYTMEGDPFKTCKNGDWVGEMRCRQPCTVDEELMTARNIQFRYTYDKKLYAMHGEPIEFRCTRGRHDHRVAMRQTCNDGVIHLPNCY